MKKRGPPADIDDLSLAEWKAVWKSIAKNLPLIAREVKLQGVVCQRHGREINLENLRWAQRQMAQYEL